MGSGPLLGSRRPQEGHRSSRKRMGHGPWPPAPVTRSLCSVSSLQNCVAALRSSVTLWGCQRAPWGPRPQRLPCSGPARPPAAAPARGQTGRQGPHPRHGRGSQTGRPAQRGPDASCLRCGLTAHSSKTVTNGSLESRQSAQRPPLRLESGDGAHRGPGPGKVLSEPGLGWGCWGASWGSISSGQAGRGSAWA